MSRTSTAEDHGWSALCLRLTVVTLPAQVVGALVGALPMIAFGRQTLGTPWLPALVVVGMGLAAGLTMGLLATPPEGRRLRASVVAAAFGLAGYLILRLLGHLASTGASAPAASWAVGAVLVLVVQTMLVTVVWHRRDVG